MEKSVQNGTLYSTSKIVQGLKWKGKALMIDVLRGSQLTRHWKGRRGFPTMTGWLLDDHFLSETLADMSQY